VAGPGNTRSSSPADNPTWDGITRRAPPDSRSAPDSPRSWNNVLRSIASCSSAMRPPLSAPPRPNRPTHAVIGAIVAILAEGSADSDTTTTTVLRHCSPRACEKLTSPRLSCRDIGERPLAALVDVRIQRRRRRAEPVLLLHEPAHALGFECKAFGIDRARFAARIHRHRERNFLAQLEAVGDCRLR